MAKTKTDGIPIEADDDPIDASPCSDVSLLAEIEQDTRSLIKKCGLLSHELDESKKKFDAGTKKILLDFIDVADAYENVLRNIEASLNEGDQKSRASLNSVRTVNKMFVRALKSSGVIPVETVIGEKANPQWHNVVEVEADIGLETETITEIIKKGYLWQGKLLRAAEVKAVRNR
jgi:molecular chaperone GrpE (heat shock protein)